MNRLTPATARNCFLVNQFATPGLGSILGGRWMAGVGQILLAVLGFLMVLGWMVLTLNESYKLVDFESTPRSFARLGIAGGVAFAASWLWALATSLSLLRAARNAEPPAQDHLQPPPLQG